MLAYQQVGTHTPHTHSLSLSLWYDTTRVREKTMIRYSSSLRGLEHRLPLIFYWASFNILMYFRSFSLATEWISYQVEPTIVNWPINFCFANLIFCASASQSWGLKVQWKWTGAGLLHLEILASRALACPFEFLASSSDLVICLRIYERRMVKVLFRIVLSP